MQNQPTLVIASHDDGFGAFACMTRLAGACLALAPRLRIVFLCRKPLDELRRLDRFPGRIGLIPADNLLVLPRDPVKGWVDPTRLGDLLETLAGGIALWPAGIDLDQCTWVGNPGEADTVEPLDPRTVFLGISMGVPYLHAWCKTPGSPLQGAATLEVGDWAVSVVLRGCLADAGLQPNGDQGAMLKALAAVEYMAREVHLLPYAAPKREYEEHYAKGGVPVKMLPGVFGADDGASLPAGAEAELKQIRRQLLDSRPNDGHIVGLHYGRTPVWDGIANALERQPAGAADPIVVTRRGGQLVVLEQGGSSVTMPEGVPWLLWHTMEDMVMTRGGITALDAAFVTHTPIAVAEEPYHWLSRRQREQLHDDELSVDASLTGLQDEPRAEVRRRLREALVRRPAMLRAARKVRPDGHRLFAREVLERFYPGGLA